MRNTYVNPGTLKEIGNSPLEQEITRLNGAQENNVSPRDAVKVISYTDKNGEYHENVRLSEDQYQTFATVQGQNAKRIADDLLQSSGYKALTDKQKAAALNLAYDYASDKARRAALDGYPDASGWMAGIDGKEAEKIVEKQIVGDFTDIFKDGKIDVGKLEVAYDQYSGMTAAGKKQIEETADRNTRAFLEVREQGVSAKTYAAALKRMEAKRAQEGFSEVRPAQKYAAIANAPGVDDKAIDKLMKAYMPDYDPNAKKKNTTELKYDYIRQDMGYSPAKYAQAFDIYSYEADKGGYGTANRTRERMAEEMDITMDDAKLLYKLFHGNYKPWDEE